MLLRVLDNNAFVATKDAAACLRDAGPDIARVADNNWAKETALPYRHLSLICAISIGENYQGMSRYIVGAGEAS
jgi:hypothetical protein